MRTPNRLLIVQALAVQPLAEVLEECGYELMRAGDPMAALRGLAAQPQLILMDMELPELPGDGQLELLRRLAASGIPVLVLSRRQAPQRQQLLLDAGAAECLGKPVRLSELLARIERRVQARPGPALGPQRPLASMTVRERDGRCDWQSPQARALMSAYFPPPWADHARLPPEVLAWLHREALRRRAGAAPAGLTVTPAEGRPQRQRLSFNLLPADAAVIGEERWLLVLHEADEAASITRLAQALGLPQSEAQLLFWLLGEPEPESRAALLGLSEQTLRQRQRQLCERLGAADLAQALARGRHALQQG
jgi:CheY-like chemotaxis protein